MYETILAASEIEGLDAAENSEKNTDQSEMSNDNGEHVKMTVQSEAAESATATDDHEIDDHNMVDGQEHSVISLESSQSELSVSDEY